MNSKVVATLGVITIVAAGSAVIDAAETLPASQEINLSPEVRELLLAEMREIAAGIQSVALALAIGEWQSIADTSTKIRTSYIMEKQLTAAQAEALERALPQEFKRLDAEFHSRAEQLASAALAHDSERVAFQYSRLLENCTACHAAFARTRFPGFSPPPGEAHPH
jgi:cytochrome c556